MGCCESETKITNTERFKKKKYILIILIVTVVIELVTLLALVGYWRTVRDEILMPRQQYVCFPLDKFDVTRTDKEIESCPKGLEQKFDKIKKETNCCGDQSDVLDKVLEKSVFERYNSASSPERSPLDLTELKCAKAADENVKARLVNIAGHKRPVKVGTSSKLFWNDQSPSYTETGLRYLADDGTIYVEKAGFYHISSQLKSRVEKKNDLDNSDDTLRHYVFLISNGSGRVLLEDVKTLCKTASVASETTSFLGAVFKLEAGDRLYVASSHPEHIDHDHHNNYFTLYSI